MCVRVCHINPINKHSWYTNFLCCERFKREFLFLITTVKGSGPQPAAATLTATATVAATEKRTERRSEIAEPNGRSSIVDALIVVF